MYLFIFIAAAMVIVHAVAAVQRPRIGVIVSGAVWLLYGVYEYSIATGALCDANCNIRVDLALFLPFLAAVTFAAWRSYNGHDGAATVVSIILVMTGLLVAALMTANYQYPLLAAAVVLAGVLGFWLYRMKTRSKAVS